MHSINFKKFFAIQFFITVITGLIVAFISTGIDAYLYPYFHSYTHQFIAGMSEAVACLTYGYAIGCFIGVLFIFIILNIHLNGWLETFLLLFFPPGLSVFLFNIGYFRKNS